jgi:hypothetical protein
MDAKETMKVARYRGGRRGSRLTSTYASYIHSGSI